MTIHMIELNDCEISLYRDTQALVKSPGFVVCDGNNILMGKDAQRRARLMPQQLNHRFWSQLSLENMPHALGQWSRHADIAYAHLQAISEQANRPENIIFAVPGNYQSDQLALLLGLSKACSFNAVGLVDAALAASVLLESPYPKLLHLDLQLHQAVVTYLEVVKSQLQRTEVVLLPSVGLQGLYDSWARHAASECIQQTRFDPMHTALCEQELYNGLSAWLDALQREQEITVELQGHTFRLNRRQMLGACEAGYTRLLAPLQLTDTTIVLSHRVARLLGFSSHCEQCVVLSEDAVAQGVTRCVQSIRGDLADLEFITALDQPKTLAPCSVTKSVRTPQKSFTQITHVLWKNKAYLLNFTCCEDRGEGIEEYWIATNIPLSKKGLDLGNNELSSYTCRILRSSERIWLHIEEGSDKFFTLHQRIDKTSDRWLLNCGDTIRLTGHWEKLMFIHVLPEDEC